MSPLYEILQEKLLLLCVWLILNTFAITLIRKPLEILHILKTKTKKIKLQLAVKSDIDNIFMSKRKTIFALVLCIINKFTLFWLYKRFHISIKTINRNGINKLYSLRVVGLQLQTTGGAVGVVVCITRAIYGSFPYFTSFGYSYAHLSYHLSALLNCFIY